MPVILVGIGNGKVTEAEDADVSFQGPQIPNNVRIVQVKGAVAIGIDQGTDVDNLGAEYVGTESWVKDDGRLAEKVEEFRLLEIVWGDVLVEDCSMSTEGKEHRVKGSFDFGAGFDADLIH